MKQATALVHLSHPILSVHLSVCHTGGSVKNGASYRITKSSLLAA